MPGKAIIRPMFKKDFPVFLSPFHIFSVIFDNFSRKHSNWVCAKDGTSVYMSQTGYIRCSRSSNRFLSSDLGSWAHVDKISNWRWNCGMHGSHPFEKYVEVDKSRFMLSMSLAMQMSESKGHSKWLAALILELGKQFGYVLLINRQVYWNECYIIYVNQQKIRTYWTRRLNCERIQTSNIYT